MIEIKSSHDGDLVLEDDLTLTGMMTGNLRIRRGLTAEISQAGMINGDITVDEGATLISHGMIFGNIVNNGGEVDIYGMVAGKVNWVAGHNRIHPTAVVV